MKGVSESAYDNDYRLAQRAIRVLLIPSNGTNTAILPGTYEGVYGACRSVVCAVHKGEGLYEYLKQEMERCVNTLAKDLEESVHQELKWIGYFNDLCKWFEQQVVSVGTILPTSTPVKLSYRGSCSHFSRTLTGSTLPHTKTYQVSGMPLI